MEPIIAKLAEQFQLPLQSPVLIFSLILFIILASPILLEKVRTPDIIGLILAGILIGPHGFNILEKSLFVDVFSTIGLLYIMFLAGLELNLIEFKANANRSIVFGVATFTIPFAVGFPVCHYLLGMDVWGSLLISSIFATHTLVTYPIASKYGVTKDPAVAITVGGTILTDTGVLVVLAVILGARGDGLTPEFWTRLVISLIVFVAFMALVVPWLAKRFFEKQAHQKHSHYIFVLAIVFLSAFLSEVASLEPIIGAFAAGLALNRQIPNSSALMNRIEYIGNSLFIPFFLISVGMIVDIRVVFDGFTVLLIALALTITAFAGKYLAADLTARIFRLKSPQRDLIFGLSSAHAAATLAVVIVGYRAGIVDDHVINAIIVIILASCVIASVVTEKAARKLESKPEDAQELARNGNQNDEQILIPLSETTEFENLVRLAVLIRDKKASTPLTVVTVVPNTDEAEENVARAKQALEEVRAEASGADVEVNVVATIDHNPGTGIGRTAREIGADLIVMNWPQKNGFLAGFIGNKFGSVLYQTRKMLWVCNLDTPLSKYTGIFVILPPQAEASEHFELYWRKIARLAVEHSATVHLHCASATAQVVKDYLKKSKLAVPLEHSDFSDWDDFLIVFRKMSDTELLIMVSAREGDEGHTPYLDQLPLKLEKHFPAVNKILVYP
ncbi:cation:proton antiporter [Comamonas sp. NLF-1-9]|uniref:cation:proton antiporter n=1 Tax=Comamonas sp. NLF-1-9 TaxID=2853163 RepID=UPI001C449D8D|nr:cation:proton antiporter [Comamonas sp. NLF-1-9]QXL83870.1 cation:proton antiporter [Comamonas sp. NLF-1-9]